MSDPQEPKKERGEEDGHDESGASEETPETFDALAAAAELDASLADNEEQREVAGGESRYVAMLESEVESLGVALEKKEIEVKRLREAVDQSREEVTRSRERVEREAGLSAERKVEKVLLGFLEVLDDLDRALEAARERGRTETLLEGVDLVRQKFLKSLQTYGVRHRPALGESFDPEHHEAVSTAPAQDPEQAGRVVAVVQEGYDIGERPLRPARVVVGKA